jgi:hypothetical protein
VQILSVDREPGYRRNGDTGVLVYFIIQRRCSHMRIGTTRKTRKTSSLTASA